LLPAEYLNGQAVNIGCGTSITVNEVFQMVKRNYPTYAQHPQYAPARSGNVKDTAAVCTNLSTLLALCS